LGNRQSRSKNLALEGSDVLLVNQLTIDCGNGILPQELFLGNLRAEIALARSHVAVGQLEPRLGKRLGKLIRVVVVTPRNLVVDGVHLHSHVCRGHHGGVPFRRIVRVGHRTRTSVALGLPLPRASGAFRQLPVIFEQGFEIAVVPLRRRGSPCAFDTAGDRIDADTRVKGFLPAEAPIDDGGTPRSGTYVRRLARTVTFAERVPTGGERDCLLVVHRHPTKGFANIAP